MTRLAPLLLALLGLLAATPLHAQATQAQLERFVGSVAHLWAAGDAGAIADLAPDEGQILLDTGSGSESVNSRHAAAALRALFGDRQAASARLVRATLAGGRPARGFGQLEWAFRARGAPMTQSQTVYIGAVWTGSQWRISEIRVIP
ncbi:MAG TPA: hypothetical protein VFI13_07045 [Gemmatimonadales bacterium]|nr:hypothetical protein [Gemmatimonadales bacterium]